MSAPKVTVKDGKMTIEIDMHASPKASTSGKNLVVASTGGNVKTGFKMPDGREVTLGLNAYVTP